MWTSTPLNLITICFIKIKLPFVQYSDGTVEKWSQRSCGLSTVSDGVRWSSMVALANINTNVTILIKVVETDTKS